MNAFSLGANYWFSKHIRFSANYVVNMFPKSEPGGVNDDASSVRIPSVIRGPATIGKSKLPRSTTGVPVPLV